jgi:cytochrome P450 family 2 subfamily J
MRRNVKVYLSIAGLDATLATLQWGILLLSSSPQVQRRCQEELDGVLGNTKMPAYSDRNLLPYCEATLSEISRIGCVDPFGLPHRCLEDTPILSYVIPKGRLI